MSEVKTVEISEWQLFNTHFGDYTGHKSNHEKFGIALTDPKALVSRDMLEEQLRVLGEICAGTTHADYQKKTADTKLKIDETFKELEEAEEKKSTALLANHHTRLGTLSANTAPTPADRCAALGMPAAPLCKDDVELKATMTEVMERIAKELEIAKQHGQDDPTLLAKLQTVADNIVALGASTVNPPQGVGLNLEESEKLVSQFIKSDSDPYARIGLSRQMSSSQGQIDMLNIDELGKISSAEQSTAFDPLIQEKLDEVRRALAQIDVETKKTPIPDAVKKFQTAFAGAHSSAQHPVKALDEIEARIKDETSRKTLAKGFISATDLETLLTEIEKSKNDPYAMFKVVMPADVKTMNVPDQTELSNSLSEKKDEIAAKLAYGTAIANGAIPDPKIKAILTRLGAATTTVINSFSTVDTHARRVNYSKLQITHKQADDLIQEIKSMAGDAYRIVGASAPADLNGMSATAQTDLDKVIKDSYEARKDILDAVETLATRTPADPIFTPLLATARTARTELSQAYAKIDTHTHRLSHKKDQDAVIDATALDSLLQQLDREVHDPYEMLGVPKPGNLRSLSSQQQRELDRQLQEARDKIKDKLDYAQSGRPTDPKFARLRTDVSEALVHLDEALGKINSQGNREVFENITEQRAKQIQKIKDKFSQDHYKALGIRRQFMSASAPGDAQTAILAELQRNYATAAAGAPAMIETPHLKAQADVVVALMKSAVDTLTDKDAKKAYDESLKNNASNQNSNNASNPAPNTGQILRQSWPKMVISGGLLGIGGVVFAPVGATVLVGSIAAGVGAGAVYLWKRFR